MLCCRLDRERNPMAPVFISYSRKDKEFVDSLGAELTRRGIPVWIDRESIPGDANWQAELSKGIDDCRAVIVVLSPHIVDSKYVAKELSLAEKYKRKVIPIQIQEWDPGERTDPVHWLRTLLVEKQVTDISALGFDRAVDAVSRALSSSSG
jgi:hypothetical protein